MKLLSLLAFLLLLAPALGGCGDDEKDDPVGDDLITGDDDSTEEQGEQFDLVCGDVQIPRGNDGPTALAALAKAKEAALSWASDARLVWVFSSYLPNEDDRYFTDVFPDGRLPAENGDGSRWAFVFQSDQKDTARDIYVNALGEVINDETNERGGQRNKATIDTFVDSSEVVLVGNEYGGCDEIKKHPSDWMVRMQLNALPVYDNEGNRTDEVLLLWTISYTHYVDGETDLTKIGGTQVTVNGHTGAWAGGPDPIE